MAQTAEQTEGGVTRQPHTNGVGSDAAATHTSTHTNTSADDVNGSTVKLAPPTHQLLRKLRVRFRRNNDAVILKALRLLDESDVAPAITDDVWANS